MKDDRFDKMMTFVHRLEKAKIHFSLNYYRDDALSVFVVVPGERWEVDFLADGTVEVERFVSNGEIDDEAVFEELFAKYSEEEPINQNATIAGK